MLEFRWISIPKDEKKPWPMPWKLQKREVWIGLNDAEVSEYLWTEEWQDIPYEETT